VTATSAATKDPENAPILNIVPGAGATDPRPVVHPWGYVSIAPPGTLAVVGRVGEHIGNRITLGHRDPARTKVGVKPGETALYDAFGNAVYLGLTGVRVGSTSADEPLVLGNVLKDFLTQLTTALKTIPLGITTGPGSLIAPNPAFVAQIETLVAQFLTVPLTAILSLKHKTERGTP
jgi:hypothetical protein